MDEQNQLTTVDNYQQPIDEKKQKSLLRGFWFAFGIVIFLALILVFEIVSLIIGF